MSEVIYVRPLAMKDNHPPQHFVLFLFKKMYVAVDEIRNSNLENGGSMYIALKVTLYLLDELLLNIIQFCLITTCLLFILTLLDIFNTTAALPFLSLLLHAVYF